MSFRYLPELGLTHRQINAFEQYRELLLAWNKRFNLTTITGPEEIEIKHFLDSLLLSRYPIWQACFNEAYRERIQDPVIRAADVGSGAGFPGIPLQIVIESRMRLDLLEASGKRVLFLQALIEALALPHTRALPIRAEDAGQDPGYRESYDWVFSRAVATLPVLLEYCLPLLKTGGYFVAYKGPEGPQEAKNGAKAATILGAALCDIHMALLPEEQGRRSILIYRKTAPTPKKYPRRPGMPSKQPLG
ncbi:MAG: 16S rRNA (guanine(527)-N(7))-methyltransferase RsmG [Clostridiales bacterium]|nr:16S rRNA (guanine(527)-N(7))-methyltransferase RsmG [Clostridiales bacterium]